MSLIILHIRKDVIFTVTSYFIFTVIFLLAFFIALCYNTYVVLNTILNHNKFRTHIWVFAYKGTSFWKMSLPPFYIASCTLFFIVFFSFFAWYLVILCDMIYMFWIQVYFEYIYDINIQYSQRNYRFNGCIFFIIYYLFFINNARTFVTLSHEVPLNIW